MMKTKVMIKAIFPSIDKEYDIKIPINELVWKVNKLVTKAIYDMNGIRLDLKNDSFVMMDKSTGKIYPNNAIILNTNIRNGSEIVFLRLI